MKNVKQETKNGCVIACLATVTENTFDHVHNLTKIDTNEKGVGMQEKLRLLGVLGHSWVHIFPPVLMFDRIYIATVPSLNMQGQNHSVVFDMYADEYVLDPNQGRKNKLVYGSKDDLENGIIGIKGFGDLIEVTGAFSTDGDME